jgi:hypothetical protein
MWNTCNFNNGSSRPFKYVMTNFTKFIFLCKKVKLSLCLTNHNAMMTYWASGGIAPRILWPRHYTEVSGELHAPAALPSGKEPPVPNG